MCGICGVVALGEQELEPTYLKSMTDTLAHRGPDDAGYLVATLQKPTKTMTFTDSFFQHHHSQLPAIDSCVGLNMLHANHLGLFLGHRRLAILDTSVAGHQPMSDAKQNIWITYNGEIYNFRELRKELQQLGFTFTTQTDTEVIIAAYQAWGIESIKKFNGMFAFALWDQTKQILYLVRDRYGIKPLYYTVLSDHQLIFASEVKSILAYKDYQLKIDQEALIEYFTFQNIYTDKTLYQDIKLLPAGNYLAVHLQSANIQLNKYWDFYFCSISEKREMDYAEELAHLFEQAVSRQLVSDVEIGSYLSGGMDSGSVTAVAAKHFPYLKTFTVGFDLNNISGLELGFDERSKSEYLSYLYKTEHYEMVLKAGDMERCMPKFAWHLEEPRVGQSYPNFYATKLAGKFVKVVLSGVGSDELFGGYPWRYYRAVINNHFDDYIDKYYGFWQRLVDPSQLPKLFAPLWPSVQHVNTRDIFCNVLKEDPNQLNNTPEDYVNRSLYFDAKTFLHGLLVIEDKLSMAHSLESRVPFLDNDLVDFAVNIPVNLKLGKLSEIIQAKKNPFKSKNVFEKSLDGKMILRNSLNHLMPKTYLHHAKQGFTSPDQSWFKGDSIDFIKKKLLDPAAQIYNYLDRETVKNIISEHLEGKQNRRLFIWSLLNFEYWCKAYVT